MNREDFDMEVINTLQIFSQNFEKQKYITLITNLKFVENFVSENTFPNEEYFKNIRNIFETVPQISVRFKNFLMFYYPSDKKESNTEQLKRILDLTSDLNTEETELVLFSPPGSSKDEDSGETKVKKKIDWCDSDSDSDSESESKSDTDSEKGLISSRELLEKKNETATNAVENATDSHESTYNNIPCKKGMECIYLKKGYCRFYHEPCSNLHPKGERCQNINNTDIESRCGYYHIICKDYTEQNGWNCPRGNSCNFRHIVPFNWSSF